MRLDRRQMPLCRSLIVPQSPLGALGAMGDVGLLPFRVHDWQVLAGRVKILYL